MSSTNNAVTFSDWSVQSNDIYAGGRNPSYRLRIYYRLESDDANNRDHLFARFTIQSINSSYTARNSESENKIRLHYNDWNGELIWQSSVFSSSYDARQESEVYSNDWWVSRGSNGQAKLYFYWSFDGLLSSYNPSGECGAWFWSGKTINTITFNSNGGSSVGSRQVNYGSKIGSLPTPTYAGHTLKGWYIGSQKIDQNYIVKGNQTLTAQWSLNYYRTTFDPSGGVVSPTYKDTAYGSKIGQLPSPNKWEGHNFLGWYISNSKIDSNHIVYGNETAIARWSLETRRVTFNPNGGSVSPTYKDVQYGSKVGTLPIPVWDGHRFDGWTYNGSPMNENFKVYENAELVAKWVTTYKIRVKNGQWKVGIPYVKDGVWKKGTPYVKVNGVWKKGV